MNFGIFPSTNKQQTVSQLNPNTKHRVFELHPKPKGFPSAHKALHESDDFLKSLCKSMFVITAHQ